MNVRQAARWADGKPDLYAVTDNNEVVCLGSYDKCKAHIAKHCGMNFAPGQTGVCVGSYAQVGSTNTWLCLCNLDDVLQGMYESDGEQNCVPERADVLEWA
jgi:hypothetical protein